MLSSLWKVIQIYPWHCADLSVQNADKKNLRSKTLSPSRKLHSWVNTQLGYFWHKSATSGEYWKMKAEAYQWAGKPGGFMGWVKRSQLAQSSPVPLLKFFSVLAPKWHGKYIPSNNHLSEFKDREPWRQVGQEIHPSGRDHIYHSVIFGVSLGCRVRSWTQCGSLPTQEIPGFHDPCAFQVMSLLYQALSMWEQQTPLA